MVEPPIEFTTEARSYYVWSRSRRAGHVLALGLGRFIDPRFRWLSVRKSPSEPSEEEGWVQREASLGGRWLPLSPSDLKPGPKVSATAFEGLLKTEGESETRTALEHYLLLPARLQQVLDVADSSGRPRVIVVANTDRVRQLYPTDPGQLRPFTAVFSRQGLAILTTSVPPPYEGRYGFDIVLRFDVDTDDSWRHGQLVVEKGLPAGTFRTGATFDAKELPWYLDAGEAAERAR